METDPPLLLPDIFLAIQSPPPGIFSVSTAVMFLFLLLICSALISASEVAYFSISHNDLDLLKKTKTKINKKVLLLKENPRSLLATILIANNFINIAIVVISDFLIRSVVSPQKFDQWASSLQKNVGLEMFSNTTISHALSFTITVIGVTFLLVLFGEIAPKIYANINNVKHAKLMASPLLFLTRAFRPMSSQLINWSSWMENRFYRRKLFGHGPTNKHDLDKAIELVVSKEERDDVDILKGIIKFGDVTTTQIMKSRVDVVSLETSYGFNEVMRIVRASGFSRIPVFEEDFDNIKGILYVKDLLGLTQEKDDFNWKSLIRKNTMYVPETKKIDDLLKEFQKKRTHMAIVVDEYGGSSGIVTLEDIMEEVVGDIKDEFDHGEEIDYLKIDEHNYIFEGKTLLNDVARVTGLDSNIFDEGRGTSDSLAGLILEIEGQIPKRDKEIHYKSMKFRIISVSKKRIEKINISL